MVTALLYNMMIVIKYQLIPPNGGATHSGRHIIVDPSLTWYAELMWDENLEPYIYRTLYNDFSAKSIILFCSNSVNNFSANSVILFFQHERKLSALAPLSALDAEF